ncbi:trafficking protein particle complex subunit 6b [Anaeramoeba flamelloides]|uniref:Trafficking protein particle complex subunit 6b n=1 Tax=Anaeramoeba flamelloides TaxID=1746091 RepID=A0AAV8AF36_9EUKA|nr:trafficking protein particle complex subunit 6b [Anaeramoeba flamelloides]
MSVSYSLLEQIIFESVHYVIRTVHSQSKVLDPEETNLRVKIATRFNEKEEKKKKEKDIEKDKEKKNENENQKENQQETVGNKKKDQENVPQLEFISSKTDIERNIINRLEIIGYRLGERTAERIAKNKPRFQEEVEKMRFVAKDIWTELFGKMVNNLRTNHQGKWMFQDDDFKLIRNISFTLSEELQNLNHQQNTRKNQQKQKQTTTTTNITMTESQKQILQSYLYIPCGIIRGALSAIGVECTVTGICEQLPACVFTAKIINKK